MSTLVAPLGWQEDSRPVIAFITHCAQLSGAELYVLRVAASLRENRALVVLGEHGPLVDALAKAGVAYAVSPLPVNVAAQTASSLLVRGLLGNVAALTKYIPALARSLKEWNVSLVYTNSAKAHVYGALAARAAGIRSISHLHDISSTSSMSWSSVMAMRTVNVLLPREIIANSQATLRGAGIARHVRPASVIHCPVHLPLQTRASKRDSTLVFGVVGRLAEWKGQDLAIRAFAGIRASLPPGAVLHLAGDALFDRDRDYEEHLRLLVVGLGIENQVKFLGHQEDPYAVMVGCDIILHTSIKPEPFGQVIVEAMAVGTPVIAADSAGPAEIIADGRDGILYRMGDQKGLEKAMLALAISPEIRGNLAVEAKVTAKEYDMSRIMPLLEDQFRRHRMTVQ